MSNYIVRVWFDVKVIGAVDKEAALDAAKQTPIAIKGDYRVIKQGTLTVTVEPYDMQVSGQVWER